MAKAAQPAPPAPRVYEPNTLYEVWLVRAVPFGTRKLLPRDQHFIKGDTLAAIVAEHGEDVIELAYAQEATNA